MTVWKIYISTFSRFIADKRCRLLTLGRIFSTQMPTSCSDILYAKILYVLHKKCCVSQKTMLFQQKKIFHIEVTLPPILCESQKKYVLATKKYVTLKKRLMLTKYISAICFLKRKKILILLGMRTTILLTHVL